MQAKLIHEKAERIRDVIRYIRRFKKASSFNFIDQNNNPKEIELIPHFSNNNLFRRYSSGQQ